MAERDNQTPDQNKIDEIIHASIREAIELADKSGLSGIKFEVKKHGNQTVSIFYGNSNKENEEEQ
jgi:hypothetical protein